MYKRQIWYQPSLFAIIDQNLGVIDDWLKELDDFFEFTYSTTAVSYTHLDVYKRQHQ